MEILKHFKKNKYFFLLLIIWILFNPIFLISAVVVISGIPVSTASEHFTETEKFAVGIYSIGWIIYGVIVFIRSISIGVKEAKEKFTAKNEKSIDQIIDEAWNEHQKEKKEIKDGKM